MPPAVGAIANLQAKIWSGSIALEIRLATSDCRTYDESEPYLIQYPRLSYMAFLLSKLHAFFQPSLINPDVSPQDAWISFEDVPLKWHYPLGLLYDLLSGAEPLDLDSVGLADQVASSQATVESSPVATPIPWKLVIHYSDYPDEQLIRLDPDLRTMQDAYINSVKEADFVRNGTARTVMSMSKDDSDNLWLAVQSHNLPLYNVVNNKLLNPPGLELRHVPTKIYLPTSASRDATDTIPEETQTGSMRVVQSLIPVNQSSKQPQTIGTALNGILPTIFPSRRNPIYARPVLHGAAVPMAARMEDLGRAAAYTDGFVHLAVVMHG